MPAIALPSISYLPSPPRTPSPTNIEEIESNLSHLPSLQESMAALSISSSLVTDSSLGNDLEPGCVVSLANLKQTLVNHLSTLKVERLSRCQIEMLQAVREGTGAVVCAGASEGKTTGMLLSLLDSVSSIFSVLSEPALTRSCFRPGRRARTRKSSSWSLHPRRYPPSPLSSLHPSRPTSSPGTTCGRTSARSTLDRTRWSRRSRTCSRSASAKGLICPGSAGSGSMMPPSGRRPRPNATGTASLERAASHPTRAICFSLRKPRWIPESRRSRRRSWAARSASQRDHLSLSSDLVLSDTSVSRAYLDQLIKADMLCFKAS